MKVRPSDFQSARRATAEAISQLSAVRVLLETHAAEEAAVHAADRMLLVELRDLAREGDPTQGARFHVLLAHAAGNRVLAEAIGEVLAQLEDLAGEGAVCGWSETARHDHQSILDAVLGGQRAAAGDAARAHASAALVEMLDGLAATRSLVRRGA